MNRNVLVITWKDYLGAQLLPCPNPKVEYFKWVKSEEKAQAILNRRVRGNILSAEYNGKFLIEPTKAITQPIAVPKEVQPVAASKAPVPSTHKKSFNPIKFVKNLFSRQKH